MYQKTKRLASQFKIVLGSGSPRRQKLLADTGIDFEVVKPELHEAQLPNETPYEYAVRLAQDKALAVAKRVPPDSLVIGCDTIVVLNDEVLEKPHDEDHAFEILLRLRSKMHVVCTAIAVARGNNVLASDYELTKVFFNPVSDHQIREYIASGEPMDKAGAYGIQGIGGFLVDRFEGSLDTVIGFSCSLFERLAGDILQKVRT